MSLSCRSPLRLSPPLLVALCAGISLLAGCASTPAPEKAPEAAAKAPERPPVDGHVRLSSDAVVPTRYALDLTIDPRKDAFFGKVTIDVAIKQRAAAIRLHGEGLTVKRVQIERANTMLAARAVAGSNGGLEITTDQPLAVGDAKLHLEYEAPLPTAPVGIYRVKSGDDWYAYTQFEPLEARKAFPSFDQPEFKTPFETTLRVPKGMTALTNGPEEKQSESGDFTAFTFAATKPLPTYLVAFAVGPFDIVEAPKQEGLPRIRTVTTKGKGKLATWANETTGKVLAALQAYFDEPYPYAKLDQVAVPNFSSGAMENVGLVTYRERLLLLGDGKGAPPTAKLYGTVVIAHELGHMWFGNKVTLAWWDDLWLNEAFATWISFKITHQVAPEMEAPLGFQSRVGRTMSWDAQAASRAIRQPIQTGGDVYNAFDPITYTKGAAVLNMLEAWLGEDAFRKGVRAYIAARPHGVATTKDLVSALSEASGKDVGAVLATFLEQPGTPLVTARLQCASGADKQPKLALTQTRYLPAGSKTDRGKPWTIPMCVRFGKAGAKGETQRHCGQLSGASGELKLPVSWCPAWVHPNDRERGYYRWAMGGDALRALATQHRGKLEDVERATLAGHLTALLEAEAVTPGLVLDALKALAKEKHHQVVESLLAPLTMLGRHVPDNLRKAFAKKVAKPLLEPHLKRLGFVTRPPKKGAAFADQVLRPRLARTFMDLMGDQAKSYAGKLDKVARAGLADMAKANPAVFSAVLPLAGRRGDKAFLEQLRGALPNAPTPAHRVAIVRAMGTSEDPSVMLEGLGYLLDGTLRAQDLRELRRYESERPAVVDAIWKLMPKHYDALVELMGSKSARHLVWFGVGLCRPADRDAFEAFFGAPERAKLGTKRMAAFVSETIARCIRLRGAVRPALEKYLGGK